MSSVVTKGEIAFKTVNTDPDGVLGCVSPDYELKDWQSTLTVMKSGTGLFVVSSSSSTPAPSSTTTPSTVSTTQTTEPTTSRPLSSLSKSSTNTGAIIGGVVSGVVGGVAGVAILAALVWSFACYKARRRRKADPAIPPPLATYGVQDTQIIQQKPKSRAPIQEFDTGLDFPSVHHPVE
ncbi:uncharacterized protein BDW43DRAFT_312284 [Aspergillus alliaceus]|uniref:uncharacterized protein n=1 Tax=Petromyces alliaceus TaxID=209559 RepID=UPI0012A45D0C|nr:uncharacterized protein BDW43DRAFT_312284 [Aspergillus alliaceus]KAB8232287.1 hypothetical protein BDW43DRAFT_312284 [Aspergillus alliaceus]